MARAFGIGCGVAALVWAGAAVAAAPAPENWPCKAPYHDDLTPADVWSGDPPAAKGDWHTDESVRKLVVYTTNPENSPAAGKTAISDFASKLDGDKTPAIALALSGMVDETNVLREAIISGIRDLHARTAIMGDALKENDDALAKLPETAEKERADLKTARRFNFHGKDDAEDETDFMCYRLGYVEKKLRALADQLRSELNSK
jgi:hypothetical protein